MAGKMKNTVGKSILIGAFIAFSSAAAWRLRRLSVACTRRMRPREMPSWSAWMIERTNEASSGVLVRAESFLSASWRDSLIRIGESRQDALKKLSARTSTPELASFVRSIIQADQLGISLGRILRVQATDSRLKRQAAAEEKAMKAPIKMLFPTVFFIFPAMFLVILGPAFLNLSKIF